MNKRSFIFLCLMFLAALFPLSSAADAGMVYRYKLIAGQSTEVGRVEVWNDAETLNVSFQVWSATYCLKETHLHVAGTLGEIPQNGSGPIPGKFDYKTTDGCVSQANYTIPLSDGGWAIGDRVVIVAHAVVGKLADPYWSETGWGIQCGDFATWSFPGAKWAAYMEYPIH